MARHKANPGPLPRVANTKQMYCLDVIYTIATKFYYGVRTAIAVRALKAIIIVDCSVYL